MRKLKFSLLGPALLVLGMPFVSIAATVVTTKDTVTTAAHSATSTAIDTSTANFIAVEIVVFAARTPTLTDSQGNTWIAHSQSPKTVNTAVKGYVFYCVN